MNVEIIHQQDLYAVQEKNLCRFCTFIMKKVSGLAPEFNWCELSLVLTDDRIRDLNREWFGKASVTDVISFAYPSAESTGEVIVNLQQAQGEGHLRRSPDHELALYIAHGCHHLMGAEDDSPEKKEAMLTLENTWVDEAFMNPETLPFFL